MFVSLAAGVNTSKLSCEKEFYMETFENRYVQVKQKQTRSASDGFSRRKNLRLVLTFPATELALNFVKINYFY